MAPHLSGTVPVVAALYTQAAERPHQTTHPARGEATTKPVGKERHRKNHCVLMKFDIPMGCQDYDPSLKNIETSCPDELAILGVAIYVKNELQIYDLFKRCIYSKDVTGKWVSSGSLQMFQTPDCCCGWHPKFISMNFNALVRCVSTKLPHLKCLSGSVTPQNAEASSMTDMDD